MICLNTNHYSINKFVHKIELESMENDFKWDYIMARGFSKEIRNVAWRDGEEQTPGQIGILKSLDSSIWKKGYIRYVGGLWVGFGQVDKRGSF